MATVEAYVPLNMLTGFNFGGLLYADSYYGLSYWFSAEHYDGTSDTLWGYDFAYDAYDIPTGAGTVTGYSFFGNWSEDLLVDIDGINVPASSSILNAAYTASVADDINVIRTALAGDDDVYGSDYADVLDGFGGDDFILAFGGNDIVYGEAGDDWLSGGTGADEIDGGEGRDTASYATSTAGVAVSIASGVGSGGDATGDMLHNIEDLSGSDFADNLTGNAGDNTLNGWAGNDFLNGGIGADWMYGDDGNDVYVVDHAGDIVNESYAVSTGYDTVQSSISFSLANTARVLGSVEYLTLLGSGNINGTGNALNNLITGNAGVNVLNGAAGADNMRGLAGNDVYVVDNAGDIVNESLAGSTGYDTVQSSISFSLANTARVLGSVEYLTLLGTGNINGTGNALNNLITGNAGINVLNGAAGADNMRGLAGNDVYVVDNAGDIVNESLAGSTGYDTVQSSISFSLANTARVLGSVEYLTLLGSGNINGTGNALNNLITGNAGINVLNGAAGADTMNGGAGNDTYYVDNARDVIVEASTGGTSDWVATSVSFALSSSAYVERLSTTSSAGTTAINLTGNGIAQSITGNAGSNVLNGAAGNDTLNGGAGNDLIYGGAGNDRLTGAAGYDSFVFNTAISAATNVDTILDFNVVQDTIRIDNAVMPGLGSHLGTLSSTAFWKSTSGAAHDSNDRIIYETDTGWLNYDSNGSAAGGAVHIAHLAPNLALSYADFLVI